MGGCDSDEGSGSGLVGGGCHAGPIVSLIPLIESPPHTHTPYKLAPHRAARLASPCCWPAGTTTARRCKCGMEV